MTFEEFRDILACDLGIGKDLINRDTSLISDLGIDSLSIINSIIKIEKKYGVKFNIGSIWEMENIGEVYDMISKNFFNDSVG